MQCASQTIAATLPKPGNSNMNKGTPGYVQFWHDFMKNIILWSKLITDLLEKYATLIANTIRFYFIITPNPRKFG